MTAVAPWVALIVLAAPLAAKKAPARDVSTPEGLAFTVPAGFSYEATTRDGGRVHVMKASSALVTLAAAVSDLEGACEATFTTAHGLDGCAGEQRAQSGSSAFAVLRAGHVRVLVIALSAGSDAAQLARAIADSIRVSRALASGGTKGVPRVKPPDERFVGCFSSGSASSVFVLCLHDDSTFRWRSSIHVQGELSDARTSAFGDGEDVGKWRAEPGGGDGKHWKLFLRYDDGREATWPVRFYNRDLVKGEGDLWTRTR